MPKLLARQASFIDLETLASTFPVECRSEEHVACQTGSEALIDAYVEYEKRNGNACCENSLHCGINKLEEARGAETEDEINQNGGG